MFDMRGGSRWLEVFIQKPESKSYPHARAKALLAQGLFLDWSQRMTEARAATQESLDFYKARGDKHGEIDALLVSAFHVDNSAQGKKIMQHALVLAQSINDKWRQARALSALGSGSLESREYIHLKEALKIFREVGDLQNMAGVMAELGRLELLNNDIESAQKMLNEALVLIRQLNLKGPMAHILQEYGRIAAIKGDYEQAYASLQESAVIYEEQGWRLAYLFSRAHLGYLALYQGEITKARSIFSETVRDFYSDKNEDGAMFTLEGMGGLSVAVGKPDVAARLIGWADMVRKKLSDPRPPLEQADVDKIIAACLAKMGEVAFSDAYDEGQAMTLDEAIAHARFNS
jgi:tetratricopeptide (TPR) repeat protein